MATDQANRLFKAALEQGPAERAAFLQGLGAADPDLRKEIESLLAAEDDSFPDHSAPVVDPVTVDKTTAIRSPSPDTKAPDRIGPYRILRNVCEVGMDVVYEAEQEKPVRRKVALKLIKWGMDTKQVIARFESERQALSLMNHPNIASVYDAGATNEGRPYFAMEYVHGIPITEYCDKHRLTITKRFQLFLHGCKTLASMHEDMNNHEETKPMVREAWANRGSSLEDEAGLHPPPKVLADRVVARLARPT